MYTDVWTDDVNVRAKDPDLMYRYADLSTQAPVDPSCVGNWTAICRITINYETHIHPIWSVDRQVLDIDGNLVRDDTCTSCHTIVDDMGAARVPGPFCLGCVGDLRRRPGR